MGDPIVQNKYMGSGQSLSDPKETVENKLKRCCNFVLQRKKTKKSGRNKKRSSGVCETGGLAVRGRRRSFLNAMTTAELSGGLRVEWKGWDLTGLGQR